MKKIFLIAIIALSEILLTNPLNAQTEKNVLALSIARIGSYPTWENFSVPLEIKNISNTTQSFSFWSPHLWSPTVTESKTGKQLQVSMGVYDGGIHKQTVSLHPNESFETNSWPTAGIIYYLDTENIYVTSAPGKYEVHFEIMIEVNGKEQKLISNPMTVAVSR